MIGEEASGPAGEMGEQAGDHRRKLGVVMLQFAVHQVELVGQRGENDSQRRKNDKTDNDDGHQRREAIALAEAGTDLVFDRIKNHREDRSPKDGGIIG